MPGFQPIGGESNAPNPNEQQHQQQPQIFELSEPKPEGDDRWRKAPKRVVQTGVAVVKTREKNHEGRDEVGNKDTEHPVYRQRKGESGQARYKGQGIDVNDE